ncbi:hypothetical protein, partial [Portibacter lacus]|uniref:hypothetical protein n=1 Tax=Portibacter lacus TaxID=1099794 RepID=UPI0024E1287F
QNVANGTCKTEDLAAESLGYSGPSDAFRSNCFIKMLAKLPDANYHPVRWERCVKKYRKRLEEHPFELSYPTLT